MYVDGIADFFSSLIYVINFDSVNRRLVVGHKNEIVDPVGQPQTSVTSSEVVGPGDRASCTAEPVSLNFQLVPEQATCKWILYYINVTEFICCESCLDVT
jgi:hypothetical protein